MKLTVIPMSRTMMERLLFTMLSSKYIHVHCKVVVICESVCSYVILSTVINPRHACAGGLQYLSRCLCLCVSVCLSVTTLAVTSFLYTLKARYVLDFSCCFTCGFSKKNSLQKLWHEKANMKNYVLTYCD